MHSAPILSINALGFPWQTMDPFLFCVHHNDAYPRGNADMGPAAPLLGRNLGQDFGGKDGWNMYHGRSVPGFPSHPHRGFETVTITRQGLIDHSDSLGATARFGAGDVQWLTAGQGVVHSEMFPLLHTEQDNPLELFQIWLNLPARSKMVAPHFTMFWHENIPRSRTSDALGKATEILCIAGTLGDAKGLPPPPDSWAADSGSDLAIWTITMEPGACYTLPHATGPHTRRMLYFFKGSTLTIAGQSVAPGSAVELAATQTVDLCNGADATDILILQGRPIGEPVVQYGPFVMNSQAEIRQAYADYQASAFGGWPWATIDPVHPRGQGRFARHADGRVDIP